MGLEIKKQNWISLSSLETHTADRRFDLIWPNENGAVSSLNGYHSPYIYHLTGQEMMQKRSGPYAPLL